jgi:hypothetical protein
MDELLEFIDSWTFVGIVGGGCCCLLVFVGAVGAGVLAYFYSRPEKPSVPPADLCRPLRPRPERRGTADTNRRAVP